jgi:hypothetical protein
MALVQVGQGIMLVKRGIPSPVPQVAARGDLVQPICCWIGRASATGGYMQNQK